MIGLFFLALAGVVYYVAKISGSRAKAKAYDQNVNHKGLSGATRFATVRWRRIFCILSKTQQTTIRCGKRFTMPISKCLIVGSIRPSY